MGHHSASFQIFRQYIQYIRSHKLRNALVVIDRPNRAVLDRYSGEKPALPHDHLQKRCLAAIAACNHEHDWNLSEVEQQRYASSLATLIDQAIPEHQLRLVVWNYHHDHAQVAALHNALHPDHQQAWSGWGRKITGVLHTNGLIWSNDAAIDSEDLVQIVQSELARALPTFAYRSRLSSWVYQLTVRCARRQVRRMRAEKRAARPDPIDTLDESSTPVDHNGDPARHVQGRMLAATIARILETHPDRRLSYVFQLWAIEDRSTEEIGKKIRLHPSRVRYLLAQARQALREHETIQHWLDDGPTE